MYKRSDLNVWVCCTHCMRPFNNYSRLLCPFCGAPNAHDELVARCIRSAVGNTAGRMRFLFYWRHAWRGPPAYSTFEIKKDDPDWVLLNEAFGPLPKVLEG